MTKKREAPQNALDAVATMSHSKTEMFLRCQFQFFQRYILLQKRPPSYQMALGRATDATADVFYDGKMKSGEDMSEDDVRERWRSEWDTASEEVDLWLPGNSKSDMTDRGVPAISRWREKIATQVMPTHIKIWFELQMEENWLINGEVDLVHRPNNEPHRKPIPSDTKMTSKRWNAKQAFSTMQAALYALALDYTPDIDANSALFQFHVSILYKTQRADNDAAQILTRRVTENEKDGALARVAMTRRQIMRAFESGDFLPNRQSMMCSRKQCGYWEDCERRFGPRVPD